MHAKFIIYMKKIFLLLALLVTSISFVFANEDIILRHVDGNLYRGILITSTDSTLTISISYTNEEMTFFHSDIVRARIGQYAYIQKNGVLTRVSEKEYRADYNASKMQDEMAVNDGMKKKINNLYYMTGDALTSAGNTALSIGIPSLLTGGALLIIGNLKSSNMDHLTQARCATAGYVLMPFGGALTIVGFPLIIKGKQLMEIDFNYTGNGAGMTVHF